jgi:nucleoside-triphosphatase THEP1
MRNPVSIFYEVISNADRRLYEIRNMIKSKPVVFVISGKIANGKTTFVKKLVTEFERRNVPVGGIISEKVVSDSMVIGYDLVDIETNKSKIFLRQSDDAEKERIGRFEIFAEGLEMGLTVLSHVQMSDKTIVIIDEVGMLELRDRGWSGCIVEILKTPGKHLLITVRENFVEEVIRKWNLSGPVVCNVNDIDYLTAAKMIIDQVNS